MKSNKGGEHGTRAALDAVRGKLAKKVAPKLERLRAVKGGIRELRQGVAGPNETVE
jgi:hypothetical protein